MKHKIRNSNEYGSARFATFEEIKNTFIKEDVSNINESGFPVWIGNGCKTIYFDRETPHYVYLGSTGCGKSKTAVIPTCSFIANAKIKRSVFITDPKGEIHHTTSKMFKDNGYNIITIDFRNPELSNKINLLEPIILEYEEYMKFDKEVEDINLKIIGLEMKKNTIKNGDKSENNISQLNEIDLEINSLNTNMMSSKNEAMKHYAETNRLISSISNMIMVDKISKDPFWNNSARNLLEGLIAFFLEEYKLDKIKRNQITLTSIKKFQNSSMEEENFLNLQNYIDKKPYGLKSKDSLTSIISASENTYKSVTAVFGEKMALFDDVNVANITSESNFDFSLLGREATAMYIIVPDEDKTYYSLITIIVGLLYRELVKLANQRESKMLPVQIDWILDEFANCPPLADIEAIVSVARSRGMRFQFFIQSFSQLDNVYGKEVAQIILDNCGLVYLKTNTQETAEAISKRLGKKTIESNSVSQSIGKLDYNGNKSTSLIGRDLMTPEEVKQLHYKTIIFPTVGYPIFRDTVMFNKFSCYKAGELKRDVVALKDLNDTYYTIEDIIHKPIKTQILEQQQEINNSYEKDDDYFKEIINELKDIFRNSELKYEQKFMNEIVPYYEFSINNEMSGSQKDRIDSINKEKYNVEISEDNKHFNVFRNLSIFNNAENN